MKKFDKLILAEEYREQTLSIAQLESLGYIVIDDDIQVLEDEIDIKCDDVFAFNHRFRKAYVTFKEVTNR